MPNVNNLATRFGTQVWLPHKQEHSLHLNIQSPVHTRQDMNHPDLLFTQTTLLSPEAAVNKGWEQAVYKLEPACCSGLPWLAHTHHPDDPLAAPPPSPPPPPLPPLLLAWPGLPNQRGLGPGCSSDGGSPIPQICRRPGSGTPAQIGQLQVQWQPQIKTWQFEVGPCAPQIVAQMFNRQKNGENWMQDSRQVREREPSTWLCLWLQVDSGCLGQKGPYILITMLTLIIVLIILIIILTFMFEMAGGAFSAGGGEYNTSASWMKDSMEILIHHLYYGGS